MGSTTKPDMPAGAVLEIVRLFSQHGIPTIIDGGWAVDALIGEQTRSHQDLDLAVFHQDVPLIRKLLEDRGFQEIPRDDSWECNFVYGNAAGEQVDIHSCTFDQDHNHIFGVKYPWASLQGSGMILGVKVRCVPPDWLVAFHAGYVLDENDYHDVKLLCERFQLPLPKEYKRFE